MPSTAAFRLPTFSRPARALAFRRCPRCHSRPALCRGNRRRSSTLLQRSNTPFLHRSNTPLLHRSNTPPLHRSNTPLLHCSNTPLLHRSNTLRCRSSSRRRRRSSSPCRVQRLDALASRPRRRVPRRSSSPRGRGVELPVARVTVTSARNERCARKGVESAVHSDHHEDGSQHERERIIGRLRERQGRWGRHGVRTWVRKKHFFFLRGFFLYIYIIARRGSLCSRARTPPPVSVYADTSMPA